MTPDLGRRAVAEAVGTAFLLAAVVGSGIALQRLTPDSAVLLLLGNAAATAAALVAVIHGLGPVSGAHLNPVVTLADRLIGGLSSVEASVYVGAQVAGAALGVMAANLMFELAAVDPASTTRSSGGQWLGEVVATLGLVLVIFGVVRSGRSWAAPGAVGSYIGAACLFTSSTSIANPAATLARTLSDTFAGIRPSSAPALVVAQLVGGLLAVVLAKALYPDLPVFAGDVVVPHPAPPGEQRPAGPRDPS